MSNKDQLDLFEGSGNEGIEESPSMDIVVPNLWGIRKTPDLYSLNYDALENLFYGLFNIEIPSDMADLMNPDEIISKYVGSGFLKRYNGHISSSLPTEFSGLVRSVDREGYSHIARMANKCKKRFSSNPGDQIKRLEALDTYIKDAFIESFFSEYRPSNREQPENTQAFLDPNIDGRSKSVYVNAVYNVLTGRWNKR
ncbi:MAG: hypothetical protein ABIF08_00035 [Nanoarchaeota archaeon]